MSPLTSLADAALSLRLALPECGPFRPGDSMSVPVVVTNDGPGAISWSDRNPLNLSYRWFDDAGTMIVRDGHRTVLPGGSIAPGASLDVKVRGSAPSERGHYTLQISLVLEGVHWACDVGANGCARADTRVTVPPEWPAGLRASPGGRALRGALAASSIARTFDDHPFVCVPDRPHHAIVTPASLGGAAKSRRIFHAWRQRVRAWVRPAQGPVPKGPADA